MKKYSCLLFLFILLSQVAVADVDTEPEKILKTSVNKVFSVLSDIELSLGQKERAITEITNSVFGFPLMAKLSLGKKHWSKINSKQREEFTSLFIELFQDFYSDKISLFRDEKVDFDFPIIENEKRVQIPTSLLSNGKKASILYKMYKTKNGWKVYDVVIEGVSLIQTYRSQYHHVIKSNKIEGLLTKMREQKENKKL
ncbi:MAG: MlaC/ttg2D family ABC transporter substrate-binding protein [Planctomycetota bacterium]